MTSPVVDTLRSESDIETAQPQQLHSVYETNSVDWSNLDSDEPSTDEDESPDRENSGQLCTTKTLYEGETKCPCCINWVEELPDDVETSVEEETKSKRHALLIRLRKSHGDGKSMVLHSIVVQSPHLRSLLGEVFQEYAGITTALKKLVFKAPFHCFFYEWDRLEQAIRDVKDPVRKSHACLLQRTLRTELKETISSSNDLNKNGVITYDYLWTIFRPGIDIYTSDVDGYDRIFKLQSANYGGSYSGQYFQLFVNEIDCDGRGFGYQSSVVFIPSFSGTKRIKELDAFPASCHPRLEEIKEALTKRGRIFRDTQLKPYHYATYKGMAIDGRHKRSVEGRIIIDPSSYATFTGRHNELKRIDSTLVKPRVDVGDQMHQTQQPDINSRGRMTAQGRNLPPPPPGALGPPGAYGSTGMDTVRPMAPIQVSKLGPAIKDSNRPELTDDLLYLCSTYVRGYCFKTQNWVTFHVAHIEDMQWHDGAFDSLVLTGEYKRLITAFVESHMKNKDMFDDVIEGKGQGLIMLLEGPPGVGKTLTAEAVSDKLRRPLYAMSAGELGNSADQVEDQLEMILEVAAKWDAVLLLDECDVLLSKRSADNLDRNSIVAIFLRLLEYYRGMLFMTTNRVEAIDPAFQSRIHLTIQYPRLSVEARRQIWERFAHNSRQGSTLQSQDFSELQSLDINGRDIKNLVKTAQLLASHENSPLSIEHIRTVLDVSRVGRQISLPYTDDVGH
ncbi:P-loop containing nucleoside triphosphate hydrolase protein [Whalleya microplaca]|nr:P-loop containing nucleoside triphosphate hydrolase protein [Whalleya microplaca]